MGQTPRKTYPDPVSSTTIPTWRDRDANSGPQRWETILLMFQKFALHCFPVSLWASTIIFRTHLAQIFFKCSCFNILHTLASPSPIWSDNSFTVKHLSAKIRLLMPCALSEVYPARKVQIIGVPTFTRKSACPPTNCTAIDAESCPYTFSTSCSHNTGTP